MRHLLVLGETGAGKSSLAKALVPYYSRVLVLDRHWEYTEEMGFAVVNGFDAFADIVTDNPRAAWRISFRTDNDAEWGAVIALAYTLQKELVRAGENPAKLLIVVEEIGLLSSPHKLPQWLGNLWNYGRHYNITAVGICRVDTETHSVLRLNSTLVFFRSSEITSKVARGIDQDMIAGLANLPMYEWKQGETPKGNLHYRTFPDVGDVLNREKGRTRLKVLA